MLVFLRTAAQDLIGSTQSELSGMRYADAISELMVAAQSRRRAATLSAPDLEEMQSKATAAFKKLADVEKELGTELGTAKAFAGLRDSEAALERSPKADNQDATFALHTEFIAKLLALQADVADSSQLSLDPDLDTYHLMLVSVSRGPAQMENEARLRGLGSLALSTHELTPERRDRIHELLGVEPMLDAEIERSYRVGIESVPEVAKTLDMAGLDAARDKFLKAVHEQLLGAELQRSNARR